VAVALAVLGLVLATLEAVQMNCSRDRQKAAALTLAVTLAEGKLDDLLVRGDGLGEREEGSFPGFPGCSWRALTKAESIVGNLRMRRTELLVTYPVPGGKEEFAVSVWVAPRR
jgi:hypothetical protein